jgi:hypothetical protein
MSKKNNQNYNPSEKDFNTPNLNEIEDGEITNDINTPNKVIIPIIN